MYTKHGLWLVMAQDYTQGTFTLNTWKNVLWTDVTKVVLFGKTYSPTMKAPHDNTKT